MSRKQISTRTRFEIFKRDGFRCLYCGATPVQKVLRVDHVVPVVEGGSNDPSNLVTSCFDCNAGKAGVALEHKKFKSEFGKKEEREHADQIREYLVVQREIDSARTEVAEELSKHWESVIGPMSQDMFNRLKRLAQEWPHDKLIEAMDITARRVGYPDPSGAEYQPHNASKQAKYFHGVLRKWREQQAAPPAESAQPSLSIAGFAEGLVWQRHFLLLFEAAELVCHDLLSPDWPDRQHWEERMREFHVQHRAIVESAEFDISHLRGEPYTMWNEGMNELHALTKDEK